MFGTKSLLVCITLLLFISQLSSPARAVNIKLTKVICQDYDKSYLRFENCTLKALSRNKASFNLYAVLLKTPLDNIMVQATLFKKAYNQEYKPFMYNTTIDFCKFVKSQNQFDFWKIIFSIIKKFSNANHTCPYDHDIIMKNFILDGGMLKMIPFPSGDYMVRIKVITNNVAISEIRAFVQLLE